MIKFNIFLLEDNEVERQQIKDLLQQIIINKRAIRKSTVQTFANTTSLNNHLPSPSNRNIFILDLEINGDLQAGLKISSIIREHDAQAHIIFLTIHDEFLYQSYKRRVNALDFIDKKQGTIRDDLAKDFDTILSNQQKSQNSARLTFQNNADVFRINVNNILYFETNRDQKRHSILVTDNNERLAVNGSLNQLAEQLTEYHFYRSHRSFLVNMDNIQEIRDNTIHFFNDSATCPVSRLKKRGLFSALSQNAIAKHNKL